MAIWDSTKSYSLGESASYNGYNYIYVNRDNPSTPGSAPNVETFNLTYRGETRSVRSWTVFDYVIPSSPLTFLPGGHAEIRGVYGDPNIKSGSPKLPQPRFEWTPTINPYKAKSGQSIEEIGLTARSSVNPPYTPSQLLDKYFERNVYVEDNAGFNAEYKEDFSDPDWSYNLTEYGYGTTTSFPDGQPIQITMGHKVEKSGTEVKLYVYAYPLKNSALLNAPDTTNIEYMALFNCFGKKFSFKYMRQFIHANGSVTYGPQEDGEVSTGEFHDNFSEDDMNHGVVYTTPIGGDIVDANFIITTSTDPAFTQEVKMLDLYEDQ